MDILIPLDIFLGLQVRIWHTNECLIYWLDLFLLQTDPWCVWKISLPLLKSLCLMNDKSLPPEHPLSMCLVELKFHLGPQSVSDCWILWIDGLEPPAQNWWAIHFCRQKLVQHSSTPPKLRGKGPIPSREKKGNFLMHFSYIKSSLCKPDTSQCKLHRAVMGHSHLWLGMIIEET